MEENFYIVESDTNTLAVKNSKDVNAELGSENKQSTGKENSGNSHGQAVDVFSMFGQDNPVFGYDDDRLTADDMGGDLGSLQEKAVEKLSNFDDKTDKEKPSFEKLELKIGDVELEQADYAEVTVINPNSHQKQQKVSDSKTSTMADISLSVLSNARQNAYQKEYDENNTQGRNHPTLASTHQRARDDLDGFLENPPTPISKSAFPHTQSMKLSNSMRWHSLQEPAERKPLRRLRDLSFSDTGAKTIQDYGALKNAGALPKWRLAFQKLRKLDGEGLEREKVVKLPDEMMPPLKKLMKELTDRGKVKQIAIMNQEGSHVLATYPKWSMSESGVSGVVKAVMGKQQMLKLFIDGEMYNCFKHSRDTMVARSLDHLVLVAQRTGSTVVVAHSLDDTPGSCVHEVSEFADVLVEKGW